MSTLETADPFKVLGVARDASEAEIRARYLECVKRFPPDQAPEKFREVHAAYQAAKDPLTVASRLLGPPEYEPPAWSDAIETQKRNPPAMSSAFLLSLGNRSPEKHRSDDSLDGSQPAIIIDQAHE